MTRQEIFDTVAKHLFAQGERSGRLLPPPNARREFMCRYRGPNGTSCAVGVLIPDDVYEHAMEGAGVTGLLTEHGDKLPAWMHEHGELLERLQFAHDIEGSWISEQRMRWELSLVALTFGLDDSILASLSFNRPAGQHA